MNKEINYWAYIGLVLGILSVFFAKIGIIPLLGILVSGLGINRAGLLNGKGKWVAISGLILSLIYTFVYLHIYGYIYIHHSSSWTTSPNFCNICI